MRRTLVLGVLVAMMLVAAAVPAAADGNAPNDGTDYVGMTLVITGQRSEPATFCDMNYVVYAAVAVSANGGGAVTVLVGIQGGASPGDRFLVISQVPCPTEPTSRVALSIQLIRPGNPIL